ncbi:MAG TPA: hypothetical protein VNN80_00100, partial [Polyangiaceae bacterium]|nr:hypothetical protein [Polyangiaceae bacterium]
MTKQARWVVWQWLLRALALLPRSGRAWLGCLALSWVALACEPKVKPGLNLQVLVIGNAAPGERANRIDVVFDRSMVGSEALGRALEPGESTPFRLQPALPGALRWRED